MTPNVHIVSGDLTGNVRSSIILSVMQVLYPAFGSEPPAGARRLAAALFHPGHGFGDEGRKVAILDVNGDGLLDVVAGSGTNVVWLNVGDGHFSPTDQDFGGASTVIVADL